MSHLPPPRRLLPAAAFVLPLALLLGRSLLPAAHAAAPPRFAGAELFLELNDTDGDLGLHASIDGEPWTRLEIESPDDRTLLRIANRGMLRRQGLTQLDFESAEPTFDELRPADFFARFPEGRYEIEGETVDGATLESRALLSHVLAAPPGNVSVSGLPAAPNCDADELPMVLPPVLIQWDPVMDSHPTLGRAGRVKVRRYQLFVEHDEISIGVDLPPDLTHFEIPSAVTDRGSTFKFEIIVQTTTGNNTAVESCFVMF